MKTLRELTPDVLFLAGSVSVGYGAWLAWSPAGFIVGGALAIICSALVVRS